MEGEKSIYTPEVEESLGLTPQAKMLAALNRTGKHVYEGTVPANVKSARRAKNKVARISRRKNRG